jgi:hypothetical protein
VFCYENLKEIETNKKVVGFEVPPVFTLVSCSAYFSTLKMEEIFFSETSVDFQWTTRRYIPEDRTLNKMLLSDFSRKYFKLSPHRFDSIRQHTQKLT